MKLLPRMSGKHSDLKKGAVIGFLSAISGVLGRDLLNFIDLMPEARIVVIAAVAGALVYRYVVD